VRFQWTTLVVIGTDCTGSCKSNYHTITATDNLMIMNAWNVHINWLILKQQFFSFCGMKKTKWQNKPKDQSHYILSKMYHWFLITLSTVLHFDNSENLVLNNISVISWRSVLLVEETVVSGENHRPAVSHWQTYYIMWCIKTYQPQWAYTGGLTG
jgi:hypothetical protein